MDDEQGFATVKRLIEGVPGWLTDEEAEALYELAKRVTGRGAIVEIGSWKGRSTICLARGSKEGSGARVYAIDPHADYRFGEFKDNIQRAGLTDLVTPIPSLSQPAADDFDEPIELLWIDGSHEYPLVREDFDKWVPKVVDGGWVAMHDTTWHDGPRRVARDSLFLSTTFRAARFVVGSTSVAQKVAENTRADRIRNRYVLGVKTAFAVATGLARRKRHLLPKRVESAGRRLVDRLSG